HIVPRRHEVAIKRRAVGGEKVLGLLEVLDAGRQAVQRRQTFAASRGDFRRFGFLARTLKRHGGDGVYRGNYFLAALPAGVQQFDRRNFLGADTAAQFDGAERNQFFVGHSSPLVRPELSPSGFLGGRARWMQEETTWSMRCARRRRSAASARRPIRAARP